MPRSSSQQERGRWVRLAEPRECGMINRGPGFLDVVRFGSSPTHFPLYSQKSHPASHSKKVEGGEMGEDPNQTTAGKPGPL
jgi:hypothetical protein